MELGIGEWIVIGLSVAIGLFFVIGNWINDQRAAEAVRWLRRGFAAFGEVKTIRLSVPTAKGIPFKVDPPSESPIHSVEGKLVMERRENLPLWAYQILRGKRDSLFLLGDVRPGPESEIHIFHKSNLNQVEAARKGEKASFTFIKEEGNFGIYSRGEADLDQIARMSRLIADYPQVITEFTLQRKSPQLALQVSLSVLLKSDAKEFFQALQQTFGSKV